MEGLGKLRFEKAGTDFHLYDVDTLEFLNNDMLSDYGFALNKEELDVLNIHPGFSFGWEVKGEKPKTFTEEGFGLLKTRYILLFQ